MRPSCDLKATSMRPTSHLKAIRVHYLGLGVVIMACLGGEKPRRLARIRGGKGAFSSCVRLPACYSVEPKR